MSLIILYILYDACVNKYNYGVIKGITCLPSFTCLFYNTSLAEPQEISFYDSEDLRIVMTSPHTFHATPLIRYEYLIQPFLIKAASHSTTWTFVFHSISWGSHYELSQIGWKNKPYYIHIDKTSYNILESSYQPICYRHGVMPNQGASI